MNEDEEEGTKKIIEEKVIDEDKYDASSLLQHRKEWKNEGEIEEEKRGMQKRLSWNMC